MIQYSITIFRHDDNEDTSQLVDHYISADQAIDLMLYVKENIPEQPGKEPEPEEPEKPQGYKFKKHTAKGARGPRKCSKCGEPGHTARTCSGPSVPSHDEEPEPEDEPEEPAEDDANEPSLTDQVRELVEMGLSPSEIFDACPGNTMHSIMTAYRKAKQELGR